MEVSPAASPPGRLGGPQGRPGRSGEEKNIFPQPEFEPRMTTTQLNMLEDLNRQVALNNK
jgi:hypothetical protein